MAHKQHADAITRRKHRVRAKLHGTAACPRLSVHISLTHVTAQLIDDDASRTIAYISSAGKSALSNVSLSEKATWVGKEIATLAKKSGVTKVQFDRGSKRYHGRIKALADAARTAGLEF